MAKMWNRIVSKTVKSLLAWLGIGSSAMLFVACYGTAPVGYEVVDDEDSIVVMVNDSIAMTIDATSDSEQVIEE